MAKRIALFNHKGGVSKTTTAFNLAWKIAERGHRVVVADTDPQCNLTGLVLGFKGPSELESFYKEHPERNIHAGLAPAFESRPVPISAVQCVEVDDRPGMLLLPGNIELSEYETTLGIAQELSGSIQALQNLPGSIAHLLEKTAQAHEAEYVVIDMSPGLGAINQNLLATSNFFIVPTAPDFFSVMAIDSLARVVPRWHQWAQQAASLEILREAAYPFPQPNTNFPGIDRAELPAAGRSACDVLPAMDRRARQGDPTTAGSRCKRRWAPSRFRPVRSCWRQCRHDDHGADPRLQQPCCSVSGLPEAGVRSRGRRHRPERCRS